MRIKALTIGVNISCAAAMLCLLIWNHLLWPPYLPFIIEIMLTVAGLVSIAIQGWLLWGRDLTGSAKLAVLAMNSGVGLIPILTLRFGPPLALPGYDIPLPLTGRPFFTVAICIGIIPILNFPRNKPLNAVAAGLALVCWLCFIWFLLVPVQEYLGWGVERNSWHAPALLLSLLVFAFASIAVPRFARISCILGIVAAWLSVMWLIATEFAWFALWNSWIDLNLSSHDPEGNLRHLAVLRIAIAALTVMALVLSVSRLLPSHWMFRRRPVCERTWPAIVATAITLLAWYALAVTPYRLPGIVDFGYRGEVTILHVVKRGLRFQETKVGTDRRSFSISRTDRRLFQYAIEEHTAWGDLPATTRQEIESLRLLPAVKDFRTPPPKALRAWNAEGWYFLDWRGGGIRSFSSELGTAPPQALVDTFREIEAIQPTQDSGRSSLNDVCLGFCYDPLAALGFTYANQRCFNRDGRKWQCQ